MAIEDGATEVLRESADAKVDKWISSFDAALISQVPAEVTALFTETALWRDLNCFTWNIITLDGREQILSMLKNTLGATQPSSWAREGTARYSPDHSTIESWITFSTSVAVCKAHIRLDASSSLCFTLLTSMEGLKSFPEKKCRSRVSGVTHGAVRNRASWLDKRLEEETALGYTVQPYCVIVGGGQAGIGLAARLRQLELPCIVLEKNQRPGDSWRNRYKSLCLHDPVWYDHLPYIPFPDNWPVFSPKDKIGDWLEAYTKLMEITYWSSSECVGASFNEDSKDWTVRVQRAGDKVVLRPKQLVLATGMSGVPNIPHIPGTEKFAGDLHHSSKHRGGELHKGKKAVILGSNNSAHDIAADLWENGAAEITMVQKTSTHVARSDTLMDLFLGDLYSESAVESGIKADLADRIFASFPYKLMPDMIYKSKTAEMKDVDKEFYEKLKKTGFMLDFGDDETGLFMKYLRRGSGYYIDVGASQLLIDGEIKLRSGVNIESVKEHSVVLTDGTEIEADLLVLATGYGSMNGWAAKLISQEVADKVGRCWGLGSNTTKDPGPWEGELRNMWKPTRQEGLWFHGGNLHQARHYSLYLALQLKARMEGIQTNVYGIPDVHHLS